MAKKNIFAKPMIGVDLGGTKIYTVVADASGAIIGSSKKSTPVKKGFDVVMERCAQTVEEALEEAGLKLSGCGGLGMGVPSPVDQRTGVALFSPNLNWRDVPVKQAMQKHVSLPVFVDNDVNMGALGEFALGAARGANTIAGFLVGTGIGGGVIIDGNVIHGKNYTGGELGHMVVVAEGPPCGCGTRGCLEAVASRVALSRDINEAIQRGVPTMFKELLGEKTDRIKSGMLKKAYRAGDHLAVQLLNRCAWYVGIAVANITNAIGPDMIILGGGVYEALGQELLPVTCQSAQQHFFGTAGHDMPIKLAELGDDSVPLGAAVFADKKLKK
jgi:glucokinase